MSLIHLNKNKVNYKTEREIKEILKHMEESMDKLDAKYEDEQRERKLLKDTCHILYERCVNLLKFVEEHEGQKYVR